MLSGLVLIVIKFVIPAFIYILIGACVMSMLFGFGILRPDNRFLVNFYMVLNQITEPVLAPIRALLPQFGAFDFSPIIVLLVLQYLFQPALIQVYLTLAMHGY